MANIHPLFKDSQDSTGMKNQSGQAASQPSVVALCDNANMLDIMRRAMPGGSTLVEVSSPAKLVERCHAARPGVLVVDTAMGLDLQRTTIQLMQDLPELVVVMVGRSEESDMLKRLAAAGQIYRFMLAPLAHGQTKLTLEAAMTQHLELSETANRRVSNATSASDDEKPVKNYLPVYLGLGVALIVVVGGVFFGLSRMGKNDEAAVVTSQQSGGAASKELALADAALAAGKLLEPPGESALDLYRSALSIDPKNARAKAGVESVADKLLGQAEVALTAEKLEVAVTILEQAREVSPDNSRLKFLDGQIARERDRLKLTQAQDTGKKVRALLADAQDDIDAGRYVSPSGNNARDAIIDARKLDPTDPTVAQMQRTLINHVTDAARRAAEQGQTDQAQTLIATARQLGSVGSDLSSIERSLTEARTKAAALEAQTAAKAAAQAQAERDAAAQAAAQKAAAEAAAAQAKAAAAKTAAAPLPPVTLKRTKTVSPVYPEEAKKNGTSGWVTVGFTVTPTGGVDNVHVVESEPKEVFDWAAMQAVEQWRFEPPMRDGKPVSQASNVKLRFDVPK
jgi:TonB family protein